jgi:hypothetical protein
VASSGILRPSKRKQWLQSSSCIIARCCYHRASMSCTSAHVRFSYWVFGIFADLL